MAYGINNPDVNAKELEKRIAYMEQLGNEYTMSGVGTVVKKKKSGAGVWEGTEEQLGNKNTILSQYRAGALTVQQTAEMLAAMGLDNTTVWKTIGDFETQSGMFKEKKEEEDITKQLNDYIGSTLNPQNITDWQNKLQGIYAEPASKSFENIAEQYGSLGRQGGSAEKQALSNKASDWQNQMFQNALSLAQQQVGQKAQALGAKMDWQKYLGQGTSQNMQNQWSQYMGNLDWNKQKDLAEKMGYEQFLTTEPSQLGYALQGGMAGATAGGATAGGWGALIGGIGGLLLGNEQKKAWEKKKNSWGA